MIHKELPIFLIVGFLTVLIDFLTYRTLIWLQVLDISIDKALGFLVGTLFAYIANRFWTFGHKSHARNAALRFVILYLLTLGANVLVNELVLNIVLHLGLSYRILLAFLIATGTSAALNFLGMKFYVFKESRRQKETASIPTETLFSLVIPCYNEAKNLPLLLERCAKISARNVSNLNIEVILVDNGSSDESPEILKQLLPKYSICRSVRVEKNQGYGFGILSGLRAAQGDVLGWTHADMQTDPTDFLTGLAFFQKQGLDIFVKGRRYGRPILDVFFTIGMSLFETGLLRQMLWDINAQPTIFSRAFFETWNEAPYDFSLDLYAYYQAKTAKLPIHRFPVLFSHRIHGTSHWNTDWRAKIKFIRRTLNFSLQLRRDLKNEHHRA